MVDVAKIREDFPILAQKVHGRPLVYLDNAATTQMPRQVLECICRHYHADNANVHRGIHFLSERSTARMEAARQTVAEFIRCNEAKEIIFTSGATDSINLVAQGFVAPQLAPVDEIIVTQLEHHSNFVVWQQLCKEKKAILRIVPAVNGELDLEAYRKMLHDGTRLVAVTQVSNLTGTVTPVREMVALAHEAGVPVLVDGAQGIRHDLGDVQSLGCDFYCFSAHKILGPTGIGVLYAARKHHEKMRPVRFGGGMVDVVSLDESSFGLAPYRFEGGTPNYVGAIALAGALDYLTEIGMNRVAGYEDRLLNYAEQRLNEYDFVRILGHPVRRAGALSFVVDGLHPYDLASMLDKMGVAVRSGTHCAQPALAAFGLNAATRVSPAFYNTEDEIDAMADGLATVVQMLKKWAG